MTAAYEFGRFVPADAQNLDGQVVTVTTHPDLQRDVAGETFGPFRVRYLPARSDRMFLLPPDAPIEEFDPTWIVWLVDVATVEIVKEARSG